MVKKVYFAKICMYGITVIINKFNAVKHDLFEE
jgi:hypothetical protein